MLVTCQRFGDLLLFGLVWQYSTNQNQYNKGSKSWLLTCSSNITLNLPSYTGSALKRELNFCNGYLSLLYFWPHLHFQSNSIFQFQPIGFLHPCSDLQKLIGDKQKPLFVVVFVRPLLIAFLAATSPALHTVFHWSFGGSFMYV